MLDVLIATYFRHARIPILYESLKRCTRNPYQLVLMVEPQDTLSLESARQYPDIKLIIGNFGSFENAMNTGYFLTDSEFFFLGVDDIEFTPNWDVVPQQLLLTEGLGLAVIGHRTTGNDCPPEGTYACHFTVKRSYVRAKTLVSGCPNLVFYPYYHHFCDTELFYYARLEGIYQSCPESTILNNQLQDETRIKTTSMDAVDAHMYRSRCNLFRGS